MLSTEIEVAVTSKAESLGWDSAALLAVVDVESGGQPFYMINGKEYPIFRFEGHYFYKRLSGEDRKKAVQAGLASPKAGAIPNPASGSARLELLTRAIAINEEAALESCSWGLGQVMGASWKDLGRTSVQQVEQDAYTIDGQIDLMTDFIEFNNLDDKIAKKDWAGFAKGYNGANYKVNNYDKKLASAFKKYSAHGAAGVAQSETEKLQMMLNTVNGTKLVVDGDFGPATTKAIKDFQIKQGLAVDGKYGKITKAKLEAVYSTKTNKKDQVLGGALLSSGLGASVISEATNALQPLIGISDIIKGVFIVLVLAGLFFTLKPLIFGNKNATDNQ